MKGIVLRSLAGALAAYALLLVPVLGQGDRQRVRTVSVPISIFTKAELRAGQTEELLEVDRLIVREKGEEAQILSIRSVTDAPLALAIVIQDDVASDFNLHLRDLQTFIRDLPRGSRVMVAYLRGGSFEVRQRFTDDLDRAARSLRIVASSASVSPRNPYDPLIDVLDRFDALPAGRRAILMFSDGLDVSTGTIGSTPFQSTDLERAILRAQRKSVSVFPVFVPTVITQPRIGSGSILLMNGQSSLERLADESGGRAFIQGSYTPINLRPAFRELSMLLNRQFLLSYLSTNMSRGYYRIEVLSTNSEVKIEHPRGYYFR
ncbi:MAG: hypothetical protein H0V76_01045 [Blastocatellia bacterium]|nr:hypothetical protein [Blastocatellia bacterium]